MNPADTELWRSRILDRVFVAIANSDLLVRALVFKGARVLRLRLGTGRQSIDLDSNLTVSFLEVQSQPEERRLVLERELERAIRRGFEADVPVALALERLAVIPEPKRGHHPHGWDAYRVRINVTDLSRRIIATPAIEIDIAAPEALTPNSIAPLSTGSREVQAYSRERIAGEKLRAYLTSLPAYAVKLRRTPREIRVKDLYDLALICRFHPEVDHSFWRLVGDEFRLACASRFVDCQGIESFHQSWELARLAYERSATIPRDIPFDEVDNALNVIVTRLLSDGIIPFHFPLPS